MIQDYNHLITVACAIDRTFEVTWVVEPGKWANFTSGANQTLLGGGGT